MRAQLFAGALALSSFSSAHAEQKPTPHLMGGVRTLTPFGYKGFCTAYPAGCPTTPAGPRHIAETPKVLKDLKDVNQRINGKIRPLNDMSHWGTSDPRYLVKDADGNVVGVERWSYAEDGKGDCEEYVILKRHFLLVMGYPRSVLLITVAHTDKGETHAVLIVRTDKQDLVLDNLRETIVPWHKTGYRFVQQQDQVDTNVWVALVNEPQAVKTTAAIHKK
ncbi:MAG: transglutaminase-like cysteine peptidase [Patescibacteria group bacterium]